MALASIFVLLAHLVEHTPEERGVISSNLIEDTISGFSLTVRAVIS